jgi:hypothetical protein
VGHPLRHHPGAALKRAEMTMRRARLPLLSGLICCAIASPTLAQEVRPPGAPAWRFDLTT